MRVLIELIRNSLYSILFYLAPRFVNVVLFILLGRLIGPVEAGIFTLALTYLIIATTVMRGLDDLVIRQVARQPDCAAVYLTAFSGFRVGLSGLLYIIVWFIVRRMAGYEAHTQQIILILMFSLIPDSIMQVAQAVLLGRNRFGWPATITVGISLVKLLGISLVLMSGGGLIEAVWIFNASSFLGMAVLLGLSIKEIGTLPWTDWLGWGPLKNNWRAMFPFLLITSLAALEGQSDIIFLSLFQGETVVGWYGAATTVTASLAMLSQAYRMSVYPLMTKYAQQWPQKLAQLYSRSMRYLGSLILPVSTGVVLLSKPIVLLVFGSAFEPAAEALPILSLGLIFVFLNVPNARLMLVHDRQNWNLLFLLFSVIVNIVLNILLDPVWGLTGAATARFCSVALYFLLSYLYVNRFLLHLNLPQVLSRAILATLVMAVIVWWGRSLPLFFLITISVVIYTITLRLVGGILSDDLARLRQMVVGLASRWIIRI